jgi:hypothetical protein
VKAVEEGRGLEFMCLYMYDVCVSMWCRCKNRIS